MLSLRNTVTGREQRRVLLTGCTVLSNTRHSSRFQHAPGRRKGSAPGWRDGAKKQKNSGTRTQHGDCRGRGGGEEGIGEMSGNGKKTIKNKLKKKLLFEKRKIIYIDVQINFKTSQLKKERKEKKEPKCNRAENTTGTRGHCINDQVRRGPVCSAAAHRPTVLSADNENRCPRRPSQKTPVGGRSEPALRPQFRSEESRRKANPQAILFEKAGRRQAASVKGVRTMEDRAF